MNSHIHPQNSICTENCSLYLQKHINIIQYLGKVTLTGSEALHCLVISPLQTHTLCLDCDLTTLWSLTVALSLVHLPSAPPFTLLHCWSTSCYIMPWLFLIIEVCLKPHWSQVPIRLLLYYFFTLFTHFRVHHVSSRSPWKWSLRQTYDNILHYWIVIGIDYCVKSIIKGVRWSWFQLLYVQFMRTSLVQCFPVPSRESSNLRGGEMIKVVITFVTFAFPHTDRNALWCSDRATRCYHFNRTEVLHYCTILFKRLVKTLNLQIWKSYVA